MIVVLRISPEVEIVRAVNPGGVRGGFGINVGWLGWTWTGWITGPASGPTLVDALARLRGAIWKA